MVPALVHRTPVVGQVVGGLKTVVGREVERQQLVLWNDIRRPRIALGEYAERVLGVIIEAASARVGAEVVIVGAVLEHQEDDVLNRFEVRAGRLGPRRARSGVPS